MKRARGRFSSLATVAGVMCLGSAAQADAFLHWADRLARVGRANLDGSSPAQDFATGMGDAFAVAVDDRYLYWADFSAGTIGRANLDGSGANRGFIVTGVYPNSVAVDDGHVYWADRSAGTI